MPLDHYLPANYIGLFSLDCCPIRRDRRLWAADRQTGKLFPARARGLCAVRNLYTLQDGRDDPRLVDKQWENCEDHLPYAIDALIAGTITARVWLATMVVFVASLMVRGQDFDRRFLARLGGTAKDLPTFTRPDNINLARLFELQRLFASVIGSRWRLLETSGRLAQITNDLGYSPYVDPVHREAGIAIPLGKRHILIVAPKPKRIVFAAMDGLWHPQIEREVITDTDHDSFRDAIAATSQRFVIGPDEATVARYARVRAGPSQVPEPGMLGFFGGALARRHELILFNLLGLVNKPPEGAVRYALVDYEKNGPRPEDGA